MREVERRDRDGEGRGGRKRSWRRKLGMEEEERKRDEVRQRLNQTSSSLPTTGSDVFSTSTDGQVLWWDIRKLVEPVETLPLEFAAYKPGLKLGGIVVEYESTMVGRDWSCLGCVALAASFSVSLLPFLSVPSPPTSSSSTLSLPPAFPPSHPPSLSPFLSPAHQVHGRHRTRGHPVLQSKGQDSPGEDHHSLHGAPWANLCPAGQ